MPVFRSNNEAFGIFRSIKAYLHPRGGGAPPDDEQQGERRTEDSDARLRTSEHKKRLRSEIKSKRQELSQMKGEGQDAAAEWAERIEHNTRVRGVRQEIFRLKRELRAIEEGWTTDEPLTGALPDFAIIGTQKGGTTSFYHLLTRHPLVEPALSKELHYFDIHFDEGIEWYRRCFPAPRMKDGRRTITGEATPYYLFHPYAARRMANVVPHARLIALLRNPVDRAYSHYRQQVSKGHETLSFEVAIEVEEARVRNEKGKMLEDEHLASFGHQHLSYLSRSVYVDQLWRWFRHFGREQMLILKSEDFFERPTETVGVALRFLGLPGWEPEAPEILRKGEYEGDMDPATRRRLEEYFEPHNRRLYELLGRDFGW